MPFRMVSARRPASAWVAARGFGLLELATALSFLVIVLGLFVSLARYVRAGSAERITRRMLLAAETRLEAADRRVETGLQPPSAGAGEAAWTAYAMGTNRTIGKILGYDEIVCDGWGHPIAYLPAGTTGIGTAPGNRPFFVSPGPDGRFLTQEDNVYSYEQMPPEVAKPSSVGGHRE